MAIKPVNRELSLAIDRGDGAAVLQALADGANPNTAVGGKDMLYRAWKERRHQIFQVLVENGARMHGRRAGREALYLARAGWVDLLAGAVERGWEMEVETPEAVSEHRTVPAELVRQGNRDGLMMLVHLGVDIRKGEMDRIRSVGRWRCTLAVAITENTRPKTHGLENLLDVLLALPPRDQDDCSDVGQALASWMRGHEKEATQIESVIQAVRNSVWWQPRTVAALAASMAHFAQNPVMVKCLVDEMPEIINSVPPDNWMGSSLLMAAITGSRSASCNDPQAMLDLVKHLLENGADPHHRFHGQTMVHCLMLGDGRRSDNDFELLDTLVGAGANILDTMEAPQEGAKWGFRDPNSKHWHGAGVAHALTWDAQILFMHSPHDGADYLCKLIKRAPALIEMRDQYGMTPLHSTLLPRSCIPMLTNQRSCLPVMEMLLDQGADPLATTHQGSNLLHIIGSAWKQGLKPKDGDACLAMLNERAPQLWTMVNNEGVSGQEALEEMRKPAVSSGPSRKR